MCFGAASESTSTLNIQDYEVSQIEPLHDFKGHIKNLWDIFSSANYLTDDNKVVFIQQKKAALGTHKDSYRGCDYRLSIITVYQGLMKRLPKEIEELLYTMKEIGRLSYLPSLRRSPKTVLRLFNVTYIHFLRCVQIFVDNPKLKKIYGTYFHAITIHLPEHARIIAPSSLYTESEERIFGQTRGIVRDTSQRTQQSVRDTGIVR